MTEVCTTCNTVHGSWALFANGKKCCLVCWDKLDRPLTDEEANKAFENAPIEPLSEENIKRIVAAATKEPQWFTWIEPPWREINEDNEHRWPLVGDQFLAAVCVIDRHTKKSRWEFWVLTWSETGLECDGESWGVWSESDVEWIARIPEPVIIEATEEEK